MSRSVDVSQTCACGYVPTGTGPNHVCIYVCLSVAVYKTHVELQIKIHTLVYICTYILKGLVQFLQSTVPIFSKNAKENIFNIYTWNRF